MFVFDMLAHIRRQAAFSSKTFGPFTLLFNPDGILAHIKEELDEIKEDQYDITEWIDVMILAIDGALRAGYSAEEICDALETKQIKNEARKWPDWRTAEEGKPINHIREETA